MAPPLIVLGVGRSGTTLLRVMLDRNSQLAIPYETFFVPQLAHRHGRRPQLDKFIEDLGRLRTLYDWGITPEDVRPRLHDGMTTREAIGAIFETYAERQGKTRWGDKTPLYMQQLPLLERLFPDARWVHLVRLELRYEDLVADPEREVGRVCEHAALAWEPGMLDHTRVSDAANMPEHRNLAQPPTPGLRDWRSQMSHEDALAFEQVAGDILRSAGYELLEPDGRYPTTRGRLELARFAALSRSWNATAAAYQRSPLWRRSHPPLH